MLREETFYVLTPPQSLLFAAGLRPTPAQATVVSWVSYNHIVASFLACWVICLKRFWCLFFQHRF